MTGIKAGSTIYLEGMEVLLALKDLKAAIKHNPMVSLCLAYR